MKSIVAFFAIVGLVLSSYELDMEPGHDAIFMNDACCQRYGGVPCGVISKSCCLGRCNNYGITQTCSGMKLDLKSHMCGNSCLNQCRAYGGIICGTNLFTNSCCRPQFCNGLTSLTRSCRSGTTFPLQNCHSTALIS
jgi:hypothetical protein